MMRHAGLSILLALSACTASDGPGDQAPRETDPPSGDLVLLGVGVSPYAPTLTVGDTLRFEATAFYDDESSVVLRDVDWQVEDPRVLSVTSDGEVSALDRGPSAVVATYTDDDGKGWSGRVPVTVRAFGDEVMAVEIVPDTLQLEVGDSAPVQVVATWDDGTEGQITTSCTWSVDDAAFATVDAGLITALRVGETQASATCGSHAPLRVDLDLVAEGSLSQTPDLEITEFDAVSSGSDVLYVVTVANPGNGHAGGFWIDLFQDLGQAPTPSDDLLDIAWVPGLAAGASQDLSFLVSDVAAGTYASWASADLDDRVDEGGREDNVDGPLAVTVTAARPDLRVTIPDALTDGVSTLYEVRIQNTGAAPAAGFWVDIFGDAPSDPAIGDVGDDFLWVSGLGPGGVQVWDVLLDDAPAAGTTWSTAVLVDTNDDIDESDETNNLQRTQVTP